jgi:hypothetical protein
MIREGNFLVIEIEFRGRWSWAWDHYMFGNLIHIFSMSLEGANHELDTQSNYKFKTHLEGAS